MKSIVKVETLKVEKDLKFQCVLPLADGVHLLAIVRHQIYKVNITDGSCNVFAGGETRGYRDGAGSDSLFYAPTSLALTLDGNVLVSDEHNHLIRSIAYDGSVTTIAGVFKNGAGHFLSLSNLYILILSVIFT